MARPAIILIIVALVLCGIKAANDFFDTHFAYGVERTPAYWYHGSIVGVGNVDAQERLPDGRTIVVSYKGRLPSVDQLPLVANSRIGDMWYMQKDGNCWVLTTLTPTSSILGWIDP